MADLRLALRSLARSPGFSLTALAIVTLGVGMTTAMLVVIDAVLLAPLPVREPEEIVVPRLIGRGGVTISLSTDEFHAVRREARTLRDVVGLAHQGSFALPFLDGERMLALSGAWTTGSFFQTLGVRPALGRLYGPEDEVPNASSSVAVLSYGAWRSTFAGDSSVIGRELRNPSGFGHATIVGVAPPGLAFPAGADFWAPVEYGSLDLMGRLAPGATQDAAAAELGAIVSRFVRAREGATPTQGESLVNVRAPTFTDVVLGEVRPRLRTLLAAAGLLLVIASVNLGILTLLRASARARDLAVRRWMGAGTVQLFRRFAIEGVLLSLGGALLGFALARAILFALIRLAPPQLPRLDVLRLAEVPVWLALGAALLPLLAALVPALAVSRRSADVASGWGDAGRGDVRRGHVREELVGIQIALAVVLIGGAALLVRTVDRLARIPLGYRPEDVSILVVAKPVDLATEGWHEPMGAMYDRIDPELRRVPGVVALTPINFVPFHGPEMFNQRWFLPGQSPAEAASNPLTPVEVGGPDYFVTFGIPLLRGRGFLDTDVAGAPEIAVVSRAFAERLWPGENPLGKQLSYSADRPPVTVVGEAGDIRYRSLREGIPTVYLPWKQVFFQGYVAIRTSEPLAPLLPGLERAVRAGDPSATIALARPIDAELADQLAVPRLSMLLASAFGATALLLAVVGLYGVMASAVRERMAELGVRSALGATPGRLCAAVLGRAALVAGCGAVAGLAALLVVAPALRGLLFEVSPTDPASMLGSVGILLTAALLGTLGPARWAMRTDPARALREDGRT
jgi:predicted permease